MGTLRRTNISQISHLGKMKTISKSVLGTDTPTVRVGKFVNAKSVWIKEFHYFTINGTSWERLNHRLYEVSSEVAKSRLRHLYILVCIYIYNLKDVLIKIYDICIMYIFIVVYNSNISAKSLSSCFHYVELTGSRVRSWWCGCPTCPNESTERWMNVPTVWGWVSNMILLMVQKSGEPVEVGSLSHVYPSIYKVLYILRWCRISSINSISVSKLSARLWYWGRGDLFPY